MKKTIFCLFIFILSLSYCTRPGETKKASYRNKLYPLNDQEAPFSVRGFRTKRSLGLCSASTPLCKCRRQGTIVCSKINCLQRLPTDNMTREIGEEIRSIIVTKQKDFTKILSNDLRLVPNLRIARFHNNMISTIKVDAFIPTQQLEILDLHRNNLRYLPSALRYLPHLRRLNVGGNKIKTVHKTALANLPNLQHLILRRNKLEAIPEMLPRNLVKLSLSDNSLTNLRDLRYLENLRILKLDSNRFSQVNSRALPTTLKELNLCKNLMSTSRSLSFDNLRQLRRLRLGGNVGITRIHRSTFFRSATLLKELDLRECGISDVDLEAFSFFPKLRTIDLADNQLVSYKSAWFIHNNKLRRITLANNRWNCDCGFLENIEDLEMGVNEEISKETRKVEFINDFTSMVCDQTTLPLKRLPGQLSLSQSLNLSSIDRSSCLTNRPRWKFEASPFEPNTRLTTTPSVSTTTRRPTTTTTTTWRPTTTTQRPTTTSRRPTAATRRPTAATPRPMTATPRPMTATPRPMTATPRPMTATPRPTTATPRPTTATPRPTTATPRPATTTPRPTTTTPRPTTTTPRPTTTTIQHSSNILLGVERQCTAGGVDCQLPFIEDGESHTSCIPYSYFGSSTWCYTDQESNTWDYCTPC